MALHDFAPLHDLPAGTLTWAPYIQQAALSAGLRTLGHTISFLGVPAHGQVAVAEDTRDPRPADLRWAGRRWFGLARRNTWRIQRALGVPYLNVYENALLTDAALGWLPGHDIVHHFHGLYRAGIARACRRLAMPYVLFWDADEIAEHEKMGTPIRGVQLVQARRLAREALAAADRIVTVSAMNRQILSDRWRVDPDRVDVLPNGVDVERWRPAEDGSETRREHGWGSDPVVAFVGSFQAWHDVATLIRGFALVLRRVPDARLVLVGDGRERPGAEALVRSLHLGSSVAFMGAVPRDHVASYLAAADVAVAPFRHDLWGSPMKLYEYMAAGRATVASNAPAAAGVIDHARNGLLVIPQDPNDLAEAVAALLADPGRRRQLADAARRDAVALHSWDARARQLEAIYRRVIESRARPVAGA